MDTWESIAKSNRTAAVRLFKKDTCRSCVSRAYYAAYAAVTDALLKVPVTMPAGLAGPHHQPLPSLIGNNMTRLSEANRWRLSALVRRIYDFRVLADYHPTVDVDEDEARITLGLMKKVFDLLKEQA